MKYIQLITLIAILNLTGVVFGAAAAGARHNIEPEILEGLIDNETSLTELNPLEQPHWSLSLIHI